MPDFMEQINGFTTQGVFGYKFDDVGNVILNPSSSIIQEHLVLFQLTNTNYNVNKIETFYDTEFVEFQKPVETSSVVLSDQTQSEIDAFKRENENLKTQLGNIINDSEQNSTSADNQSIKDIIIQLRIQSGEGKTEVDFDTEFPYLPIDITDT